jgi:hypothetical protein
VRTRPDFFVASALESATFSRICSAIKVGSTNSPFRPLAGQSAFSCDERIGYWMIQRKVHRDGIYMVWSDASSIHSYASDRLNFGSYISPD